MTIEKVGRLAFREEGKWWIAYWVPSQHSMASATRLGSIRMTLVLGNRECKDGFIALMREAWADLAEERLGVRPTFPDGVQPAPEHERAGQA